jgi:hypothetical protein
MADRAAEGRGSSPLDRYSGATATSAKGHEDKFLPIPLSSRCRFSPETFIGTRDASQDRTQWHWAGLGVAPQH